MHMHNCGLTTPNHNNRWLAILFSQSEMWRTNVIKHQFILMQINKMSRILGAMQKRHANDSMSSHMCVWLLVLEHNQIAQTMHGIENRRILHKIPTWDANGHQMHHTHRNCTVHIHGLKTSNLSVRIAAMRLKKETNVHCVCARYFGVIVFRYKYFLC